MKHEQMLKLKIGDFVEDCHGRKMRIKEIIEVKHKNGAIYNKYLTFEDESDESEYSAMDCCSVVEGEINATT